MYVHYSDDGAVAACGYVVQKHLRHLDYVTTWNAKIATPVNCLNCVLFHRPYKRKIATWENVGKKAR